MKKYIVIGVIAILFLAILIPLSLTKHDKRKKFVFWSIGLKFVYEKQMNQIIKDFEKQHPDYKIVWVDVPIQEIQKRTLAAILSSNPPDLINLNPDFSALLVQRNTLRTFNSNEVYQFNQGFINKLKYNGEIYALPFYATSPVTIYNKRLYDKCIPNTPFPKTYDELFNISQKLKNCSNIPTFSASLNENDYFAKILNKYGIYNFNDKNQQKKAIKVFSMFNKMYKNNELPKDILTINHIENVEKYMSSKTLSMVVGANFVNTVKKGAPDVYKNSNVTLQLLGDNSKYDIALMNLVIPKKSKNQDLALEFALTLTNKDNQIAFSKSTNVFPANKYALEDEYFKNCSGNLYEKSRCIGVKQIENLSFKDFGNKNKNSINQEINKTLEEILLNNSSDDNFIKEKVEELAKKIDLLQK